MSFDTALPFVLSWEGGFSDDPADHGGATNKGIIQRNYDAWRHARSLPTQSVALIEDGEVAAIYHGMFWWPAHCQDLPPRLATVQFNTSVQRAPSDALRMLQTALGVVSDGKWGPSTQRAVLICNEQSVIGLYFAAWEAHIVAYVAADPTQARFEDGWRNRLAALKTEVGYA